MYRISGDGKCEPVPEKMPNEDELQRLLEMNPELLPGDHINPDSPCRWMLIRREMPIPSPETGQDTWSLDLLLADQDATPTLVECKLARNPESRRKIIGQIIEYAANAQHYWPADSERMIALARESLAGRTPSIGLEDFLSEFSPSFGSSSKQFFDEFMRKLEQGEFRIILALDTAESRLKSAVEFLQNHFETINIYLVELRRHEVGGEAYVIPKVFGYSERIHQSKREAVDRKTGHRTYMPWDEQRFLSVLNESTATHESEAIKSFLHDIERRQWTIAWGTGGTKGSFGILLPTFGPRRILSVYSTGYLEFNLGYQDAPFRETFTRFVARLFPQYKGQQHPSYRASEWLQHADTILQFITEQKEVAARVA